MVVKQVTAFVALDGSLHYHEDDARAQDRLIYRKQLHDIIRDSIHWVDQEIDMNGIISDADNIVRLLQEIRCEG